MAHTQKFVNCMFTLAVGLPLAWGAVVQAEQPYQVE
jgi:hypothetical protein